MLPPSETASTPWLRTFNRRSRVFCIAGAGYTDRALAAAGHRVTAVDINPLQLGYAQSRAAGGPLRIGVAERLLAFGRNSAKLAGWSRLKLADNLSDPAEQVEYWDRRLDSQACSLFVESLPRDFGPRLRQRLPRTWAMHPTEAIRMLRHYF